ncbi:MAG: 3-deoxy-manno-octulosonate cytidylyltransferase [Planctomycetota bacterium]
MAKVIVIPARLASQRFPGKLLQDETGWPLIRHTYTRCTQVEGVERVVVAADGSVIAEAVESFGAEAILTDPGLPTGTDRVAAAALELGLDREIDRIVNVQGDEPEIDPDHIARLFSLLEGRASPGDSPAGGQAAGACPQVATLAARMGGGVAFRDPNRVKVVVGEGGRALYFSRAPIPYGCEDGGEAAAPVGAPWLLHVGIYGFRPGALERFSARGPSPLERREKLEQLRFLEMGIDVRVGVVGEVCAGIDSPEDYRRFVERLREGRNDER